MLIVKYKVLCSHCLRLVAIGYNYVTLPEAVWCCLQTFNSCIIMYMMGLMLGQSLMVTGVIVIVLHANTSPYYNIWHKVISYCFHGN